ncbi:hypothetical protein SISSUDRAFT_876094 [Sistotremastrum suecicum HHB10207 ss-3]|uniref:Arrestin-like N-terminal domain-containing protein n=1 Tax=Sistotremastrum suecicum HHB10207 ss-3 TaxID=1314776 RepID=A0A166CBA3_9AGAM|nr:hypothetical protein SISSUDRAFT_876094 [Sistotremastrum suecicum HHB10207 ss-3]
MSTGLRGDMISLELLTNAESQSTIAGLVHIDFKKVIEKKIREVRVELIVEARSKVAVGNDSPDEVSEVLSRLYPMNKILWTATSDETALSDLALLDHKTFDFWFSLSDTEIPESVPAPSFSFLSGYSLPQVTASISYAINVIGKRSGQWSPDVHLKRQFNFLPLDHTPLIPQDHSRGKTLGRFQQSVRSWKDALRSGDGGRVELEFWGPDAKSVSCFQPIPISIIVKCFSKHMSSSRSTDRSAFTFPPKTPLDIELRLRAICSVTANERQLTKSKEIASLGQFGRAHQGSTSRGSPQDIVIDAEEPTWIAGAFGTSPSKGGRWRQTVSFRTHIVLSCAPTFETSLDSSQDLSVTSKLRGKGKMSLEYELVLKVSFPGLGNNVTGTIPLKHLTSGLRQGQTIPGVDASPGYTNQSPGYSIGL